MNLATVDAPGVIFHNRTCIYKGVIVPIWVHYISYMYVTCCEVRPHTEWALALSVQLDYAMREPQDVEQATSGSHVSFFVA